MPGDNTHLWEESWDDDDTSEDFSAQLKYVCHSPLLPYTSTSSLCHATQPPRSLLQIMPQQETTSKVMPILTPQTEKNSRKSRQARSVEFGVYGKGKNKQGNNGVHGIKPKRIVIILTKEEDDDSMNGKPITTYTFLPISRLLWFLNGAFLVSFCLQAWRLCRI